MSGIAKPFLDTPNATKSEPINIERVISYSKEDFTTPKANPGGTTPVASWVLRFQVKSVDEVVKTVDWVYPDEATLDADLAQVVALITNVLT